MGKSRPAFCATCCALRDYLPRAFNPRESLFACQPTPASRCCGSWGSLANQECDPDHCGGYGDTDHYTSTVIVTLLPIGDRNLPIFQQDDLVYILIHQGIVGG